MKLLIAAIPFLVAFGPFDSPKEMTKQGNLLFSEGKYEEAIAMYDSAAKKTKNKAPLEYNKGNALLKKGDVKGAINEYRKSISEDDASLRGKSFYNMGNALYMNGDFKESSEYYKKSLRIDPGDEDAKRNLELALKRLEEARKKRTNKNDEENKKEGKKDDQKEEGSDSFGNALEKGKEPGNRNNNNKDNNNVGKEMTREEAERLLNNLTDNMDLQIFSDMLKKADPKAVERDW